MWRKRWNDLSHSKRMEKAGKKWQGDSQRDIEFWQYYHMINAQIRISQDKILWDFELRTKHLLPVRRTELVIIQNKKERKNEKKRKKRTYILLKIKERKTIYKYLYLSKELKILWNMRVTAIVGGFGTILKGSEKDLEQLEIGRKIKLIQITKLFRTTRILRRVLETRGDLLSLQF